MIKKKAKPATKTMATAKAGSTSKTNAANAKVAATASKPMAKPTSEERYRMVETTAYFIAEQHCFQGCSDEHWTAAERKLGL